VAIHASPGSGCVVKPEYKHRQTSAPGLFFEFDKLKYLSSTTRVTNGTYEDGLYRSLQRADFFSGNPVACGS
jgi:hypothetical protein